MENNNTDNSPKPDDVALAAKRMGIISFFFGVVLLSITTLKLVKVYKQNHNGSHCKETKTAQICGILSLILWIGIIAFAIIAYINYN